MGFQRRRFLSLSGGLIAAPFVSRMALAQQPWPTKPLKWVVGFPPGGAADIAVRIVANWLSERLAQPVVVENKPGAATNISIEAVAQSPPDGHTLVWLSTSAAINVHMFASVPYNLDRDIALVCGLVDLPLFMPSHPSFPARNIPELVAYAKANPGKVSYGSYGTGTASHVAAELLKMMAGVEMTHVPYRGSAPMINDILSGQLGMGFDTLSAGLPHVQAGAIRPLAFLGDKRLDFIPGLPTVGESVPGYSATAWGGVGVRRGAPAEAIERLAREIRAGLADATVKEKLRVVGTAPLPLDPPAFEAFFASELDKWGKVVKFANIKPD